MPISTIVFTLDNVTTDEKSELTGAMLASSTGNALEVRLVTGTLDHSPGDIEGLTVVGGDADQALDPTSNGWGNGTVSLTENDNTPANQIYARLYDLSSSSGSGPLVIGVIAPNEVLPTTGNTVFTGAGFVTGSAVNDTNQIDGTGVSTLTVNWAGTVDAEITGNLDEAFDTVTITGMTRTDTTFAGGTVTVLNNGANVTTALIGADATGAGSGGLFGATADDTDPAEAGGVFLTEGSNGVLGGGFLGTWASRN